MTGGEIEIVQASHNVDMDKLEDIVNTHDQLHVGLVAVHDVTTIGEVHQTVAVGVLRQERVVLVAEGAPEGVDSHILTPLQFLQQGDAVEKFTVYIPKAKVHLFGSDEKAIKHGLADAGLPGELVGFIEDTDHRSADEIMKAVGLVDLLIPRGGAGLIKRCVENAIVPCVQTGTGICHIFVDESADQEKALRIIENAKTSRPSVCNAEEVLLVHEAIAGEFLPKIKKLLVDDREAKGLQPVELRLDEKAAQIIPGTPAGPLDFDTEFLDYILAVKVVKDADAAISHIAEHSTGHSEAIITENAGNAEKFTSQVDSAAVYVNVSTRFTDGGEFGLGCEMGISTQKMHARGPMGLEELNTYKYVIRGDGQIR